MKMPQSFWEAELRLIYEQRDKMFHEIGLLLEDSEMIFCIGKRTFREFDEEILMPAAAFFHPNEPKEVWKYRGHRVSLIRLYCDMFNFKEPEPVKRSLADLHQHE